MHISSVVLVLAGAGAYAAPAPAAEAEPWCWRPGQPCWKVKRVAEAFSESIKSSGALEQRTPEAEFSNSPGGAAYTAKRSLNELAHVASLTAREPAEYYRDLELETRFHADQAPGKRDSKRDTGSDPAPMKDKRWCGRPGQPCWKAKRAAEAVINEIRDMSKRDDGGDAPVDHGNQGKHFPDVCNGPNILCLKKKREASPDASPYASPNANANAEPWCWRPGEPCWKAKRDASPDANAEPWCWRPGEPCWKAKRDLNALELAARNVVESLE